MSVRLSVVFVAASFLVACNSGSGNNVVLRMQAEMAGAHCANGGVAVQIGFDANSNQALDDSEVNADQTKYVCNGAAGAPGMVGPAGDPGDAGTPGLNALSLVTAEPAGSNCRYGGVRVDVGMDTNADGTLGASEITSTRYVCDRSSIDSVYFGDITIRTAADVAQLAGIQTIAGTLTIESLPGGVLTLPDLKVVSSRIVFVSRDGGQGVTLPEVTSATFPELRRAGELSARFNTGLVTLSAAKLERVTRLDVSYADALTTLTLPLLASVDDLFVMNDPGLTTLAFPALRSVQTFQVSSHALLTSLTVPLLTEAARYFNVSNNDLLSVCAAWSIDKQLVAKPASVYLGGNDEGVTCTAAQVCVNSTIAGISNPLARCVRPLTFADAQTACAAIGNGAALAWLTSDAEWTALSTAVSTGTFMGLGWLGYTDAATEGTWVAVSGFTGYSPTGRTDFWGPGSPTVNTSMNGVELFTTGLANDQSDQVQLPYLCRVP